MPPSPTPAEFIAAIGGHPIVAQILWRRGYKTLEAARAFLDPYLYHPFPPSQMPGMREAVERLGAAIQRGESIRVWGDFDVDGQTSTSLLLLGLQELGARVDYTIPNRAYHSHGLNKQGIRQASEEGVRVLLTCDCGVTDFDEIAEAKQLGLEVIISDHHDLGHSLPDVCAVINPKRLPSDHPIADLPGVGVAYKLMEGLYEAQGRTEPAHLLDLVALGIVADVATQLADTRYLLQRGLAQLRSHPRPGVRALLRVANLDPAYLGAEAIGFQLGPRLNAVGRLDDATLSIELLTTTDEARAEELAARVEGLNQERKELQRKVEDQAFNQIAQDKDVLRHAVIVLTSPDWHPSVLGVVASAVSNRYHKPAILISAQPGKAAVGRGSARSVSGVDIHAAITAQHDLVETSGGHPMAAGFAIRSENVAAFRAGVSDYVAGHYEAQPAAEELAEAVVAWQDVTLHLSDELERLAPFGPGNPRPPLKCERLRPVRTEPVGSDGRHQAVFFQDGNGVSNRVLWWRSAGQTLPDVCDLVFTLQRDVYKGKARPRLEVVRLEQAGQGDEAQIAARDFTIIDRRQALNRKAELQQLLDTYGAGNVQAWEEGPPSESPLAQTRTRRELEPKPVLVILSQPPGHAELEAALERATPQTVVLLTQPGSPERDTVDRVLPLVEGMIRRSEKQGDSLDNPLIIARMAARIGQSEDAIRACIAHQRAAHMPETPERHAERAAALSTTLDRIRYILDSTRGYRRFFQEGRVEEVLRELAD